MPQSITPHICLAGPFFLGHQFSSVDAAILPWLLRNFLLQHYRGFDMFAGFDKLRSYVEVATKNPIVTATYKPPAGKDCVVEMIEIYKAYGGTPTDLFGV